MTTTPFLYELDAAQCAPETATVWTAHLPASTAGAAERTLETLAGHPALTGEHLHEDSYNQWGEPDKNADDDPDHLALYYRAPDQRSALEVATTFLTALAPLDLAHEVVVTCAGDWEWDATLTLD